MHAVLLAKDKRLIEVHLYPAQELEKALDSIGKPLVFIDISTMPAKISSALSNEQVGVRLVIPTLYRNALYIKDMEKKDYRGKTELTGLGNLDTLELTRVDSLMSIESPSLSERMKSLVVTDTN